MNLALSQGKTTPLLPLIVYGAIGFVTLASVYDAWLVFKYREVIIEQNPVCDWLIQLEPTYVSVFLFAKIASTFVVAGVLVLLFRNWTIVGVTATTCLFAFQVGLMCYLHFSESKPEGFISGSSETMQTYYAAVEAEEARQPKARTSQYKSDLPQLRNARPHRIRKRRLARIRGTGSNPGYRANQ